MQRPAGLQYWLLGFLVGGTMGIVAVFGPFVLLAPQGLHFGLLAYHAGRTAETPFAALAYKGGFVLRLVHAYWPLLAAAMLLPWMYRGKLWQLRSPAIGAVHLPLGVGFVAVTLVHLLSVFPYDDYQVFIMPLAMILVALPLARVLEQIHKQQSVRLRWMGGLLMALLLFSLSGAQLQSWLVGPRDVIWWPLRERAAMGQLRDVGQQIRGGRTRAAVDGTMITQDLYVAVESGYRVPRGMEMGPFSNFWDLSDTEAARFGVLHYAGMYAMAADTDAEWAVYSDYGFSIAVPAIVPVDPEKRETLLGALHARFDLVDVIPAFGQAMTELRIYQRRRP